VTGVRWAVAIGLLVVGTVLTPVTVVARYVRAELLDTDRYVATVAPLARDPAVQDAVADIVTREVFRYLDVEDTVTEVFQSLADRGAPQAIVGLASPITAGIEDFARDEVRTLVASDRFAELWVQANRVAHDELDAVLTGERQGALQVDEGTVSLDLGDVVDQVSQRLVDRGFSLAENVPEVDSELTILHSDQLARAQTATRWLDRAATLLPFVVVALIGAAVAVAPNRRRALIVGAVGVAASMVLLAGALAVLRSWYLGEASPRALPPDAAESIVHTLLTPLRTSMRAVLVLGLVVTLVAWVTGPAAAARAVRRTADRAVAAIRARIRGEREPAPVEVWIGGHKTVLRLALAAAGVLVLAFWTYPTGMVVLGVTLAVAAGLAVIEVAGRPGTTPKATPAT
jgi:hypothetical protein